MGAFPLDKPKYIMFLLLDEPKPTEQSHGLATAGWNVAPTFQHSQKDCANVGHKTFFN